MSFKQTVQSEISSIFLNPDEFGEFCELASHENVQAVITSLELEMPPAGVNEPGTGYEGVTVHVAVKDVPDRLLPNRKTTLNGEEWFVLDTAEEMGLRSIRLYRERA